MDERSPVGRDFEWRIGRLLIGATYVAVGLLSIGVALMAMDGISPLAGGPALDLAAVPAELRSLDPAGFLWLGLLAVIATPISRVMVAALGFARGGDRTMTLIALGVLLVVFIGIVVAQAGTA